MDKLYSIGRVRKIAPSYHNYTTHSDLLSDYHKRQRIFNHHIEGFIRFLDAKVEHRDRYDAQFLIENDRIQMPYKCYFKKLAGVSREQNYYSTLFHELTHWSGHKKRLKRESLTKYNTDTNSVEYNQAMCALEEVTAELGANMLMEFFELQKNPSYQSLGLINKELSYFEKADQELIYIKATKQATQTFKFFVKQYALYVSE